MTSNHLLIYHLADLMLKHEQNILPVDLLFDDEQIGDFVKSIQIDSPYQQMLLEGVLTESVKEEKLYVGFTVEGYFHYVLGEVIYSQTIGLEAVSLKQITEENKLNGAIEGVEQCLIRDVMKDDFSRLIPLIDYGDEFTNVCSIPLAHSFLNLKSQFKTEIEQAYSDQINRVLNELLLNSNDNDINALSKAIEYLTKTQKNIVVSLIYKQINKTIVPDNLKKAILYIKSIELIEVELRKDKLELLNVFNPLTETEEYSKLLFEIADQYLNLGEYNRAMECHEKCLNIRLKTIGKQHPETGNSYNNIGMVWNRKGNYNKSIEFYEKALEIRLFNYGVQNYITGTSYNNLGMLWLKKADYIKANDFLEKSLAINLKVHGEQHPSSSVSYNNLGLVWKKKGDIDKAIEYQEKALKIRLNVFEANHPHLAVSYNNLGTAWLEKGNSSKAIEYQKKSLSIEIKTHGQIHPATATSYNNLGLAWEEAGNYDKAIENYEKALDVRLKFFGDMNIIIGPILNNLGLAWAEKGEFNTAIDYFNRALIIIIKNLGENHHSVGATYNNLGNSFKKKNELTVAKTYYLKAYQTTVNALGNDHPNTKKIEEKITQLNDI